MSKEFCNLPLKNVPKRTFDFIIEINAYQQQHCTCKVSRARTVAKLIQIAKEVIDERGKVVVE